MSLLSATLLTPQASSTPTSTFVPGLDIEEMQNLKIAQERVKKTEENAPRSLVGRTLSLTPVKKGSKFFAASPESDDSATSSPEKTPPQKSKFFASSSDSSTPTTPVKDPTSPDSTKVPATPSPLKAAKDIIRKNKPEFNLMRKDQEKLEKGMECLKNLSSPQHSAQVQSVSTLVKNALGNPALELRSPGARRNLMLAMEDCAELDQSWITSTLKPTGTILLDRNHHTRFVNGSGKHICPIGDPLDDRILKRRINLETGVWCGMITTHQEEKFSSFIPRSMTEEQYYSLVQKTQENKNLCIAQGENKGLYIVHGESYRFCIEVYSREDGAVIRSAFPIFHYENYNGKQKTLKIEISHKWSIDENDPIVVMPYEISYQVILDCMKALNDEALQYETEASYIVDVNLLVGSNPNHSCPIPRGILVNIPKKFIL